VRQNTPWIKMILWMLLIRMVGGLMSQILSKSRLKTGSRDLVAPALPAA
jgi:hypothetical protein